MFKNYALILESEGHRDQALQFHEKALRMDASDVSYLHHISQLSQEYGATDLAFFAFESMLKNSKFSISTRLRGLEGYVELLVKMGDMREAYRYTCAGLKLEPGWIRGKEIKEEIIRGRVGGFDDALTTFVSKEDVFSHISKHAKVKKVGELATIVPAVEMQHPKQRVVVNERSFFSILDSLLKFYDRCISTDLEHLYQPIQLEIVEEPKDFEMQESDSSKKRKSEEKEEEKKSEKVEKRASKRNKGGPAEEEDAVENLEEDILSHLPRETLFNVAFTVDAEKIVANAFEDQKVEEFVLDTKKVERYCQRIDFPDQERCIEDLVRLCDEEDSTIFAVLRYFLQTVYHLRSLVQIQSGLEKEDVKKSLVLSLRILERHSQGFAATQSPFNDKLVDNQFEVLYLLLFALT